MRPTGWHRSPGASVGVRAEDWVSGQDLSTVAQGSASPELLWHLPERHLCHNRHFKMEHFLCPTKTPPLGQNSLFFAWVFAPHPEQVTSSGGIHPIFCILPGQLSPAQSSSCLRFWTLPSFLLGHQGFFLKCRSDMSPSASALLLLLPLVWG